METRQIVRNALITALVTIVLYGFAFTWGAIYHQTRPEIWGLPPSLFPLSTQHTYLQAIFPASTAATAPFTWANNTLGYWFAVLIVLVIGGAILAARFYTGSRLEAWSARQQQRPRELSARQQRMVRWGLWPFVAISVILGASFAAGMSIVLLVGPPLLSAQIDGERAWAQQEYLAWPAVTWTDENGQIRHGFLNTCASPWCAVVNAEGAEVVDTTKIKRIGKKREPGKPPATATPPTG